MISAFRLRSFLLLFAMLTPAQASPNEPIVARLGERTEGSAAWSELEVVTGSAQRPGGRVRIVDLTAVEAGLSEIRSRQLPQALALRPRAATLSLGSTDLCGATTLREFARELHVVTELLRRNVQNILISTLAHPDETCARSGPGLVRRLEAFNVTLRQTAERNRLRVVDAAPPDASPRSR